MDVEREQIESLIVSWFDRGLVAGVELLGVKLKGTGGRQRLTVVVDCPGSVNLSDLVAVSRDLEDLLDRKDSLSSRYVLEVTSPGGNWPLKTAADFNRNIGRRLQVVYRNDDRQSETTVSGVAERADDRLLVLRLDRGERVEIALDKIISAKKVFDFRSGRKAGKRRRGSGEKRTG